MCLDCVWDSLHEAAAASVKAMCAAVAAILGNACLLVCKLLVCLTTCYHIWQLKDPRWRLLHYMCIHTGT